MSAITLTPEEINEILHNPPVRQKLARENIRYFFALYLSHHATGYPIAPFHEDFFTVAEDERIPLAVILAFRGCAKSTIFSLCYPIWAITGRQQKKFIVIVTQTQQQARKSLDNIKNELEGNGFLKTDIGPFMEDGGEWSAVSVVLEKYNARIMVASIEQSIRGLRHKQYRPDVIILDDPEDLASVKTDEGREKLYDWYTGDVVPLGDKHTRIFYLGTRLHREDLPSRLIDVIKQKKAEGAYKVIPIVKNQLPTWPGKYPDLQAIQQEKQKVGNRIAWEREYMINLISPEEQLIKPEWIGHYDTLPALSGLTRIVVGVDLAIQQKESSDYTAMIAIYVFGKGTDAKYFVVNPIINKRFSLHAMAETAYQLYMSFPHGKPIRFVVEDVGYQLAAIQELLNRKVPAEGTKIHGQDKYTRVSIVSPYFEQKRVFLPNRYSEKLEEQLTGFPNETHDDMVDALVYALLKIQEEEKKPTPRITWIGGNED